MKFNKQVCLMILIFTSIIALGGLSSANTYVSEISFSLPDSVYITNENISFIGTISQANYSTNGSLVSSSALTSNSSVNVTIQNTAGINVSNYTFTTDSNGKFYSWSPYYIGSQQVKAPSDSGDYYILIVYTDPNITRWFSRVEIQVVNYTIDTVSVKTQKATYNAAESIVVEGQAQKTIGDQVLYVSNITVNGSLMNSSLSVIERFNCTTGNNGKCSISVTAPSTYGQYFVELDNFKAFTSVYVVPFKYTLSLKDELGKSPKSMFALGEQASVEVSIINASSTESYSFSGYVIDSSGNVVSVINSTTLNSNNSFTNIFTFTVDALTYSYKAYRASVTISKVGDGSTSASAPFEVKDWTLALNKRSSNSGFEYEYSTFPNKTLRFEIYPTWRSNGSVIQTVNVSLFSIALKDSLNNVLTAVNTTFNSSCANDGCYEFSINSSGLPGQYKLSVTLVYSGSTQVRSVPINVITGVASAQSTDKEGAIKELFGTNEYVYISLSAYNMTASQFNLSNAELILIQYMNGTELNYTNVTNFGDVNATNTAFEWAWNSTAQRLKLDVPKDGGMYTVYIWGNNRTLGTSTKFIVNPYDICTSAKDTPGTVNSGNYYVWQFKKTDPVYFEFKITQATNPLGKALAQNSSTNSSSSGRGAGCTIDTTTKQAVINATITIVEVKNYESGASQNINVSESSCQASDSSGGYSCTIKPLTKWDGGVNTVIFKVQGADGTTSFATGRFEARAFYIYGYSQNWQNSPSSNLTLNVQIYEAGSNWWSGGGTGGLGGTVTVKKVEYQGRDGEWIWPPVSYGYNVSALNSSVITSGSGSISLPVTYTTDGTWKTGYYRVLLQATTSSGDTDYGYAWFGIKLWDVYGMPIECTSTGCAYKNYYNSKENITLYVKISTAGDYNYNSQGGQSIGGNVSIGIKKITDCRLWPCKELNSSDYTANTLVLNESSPWYWSANLQNQSKYMLTINNTRGTWNTGYYSVVLDVNGTDTGYAWFNTIAFYVETQPTNSTGTGYKYSLRGSEKAYFNVTTVKSYKNGYYYNGNYIKYNLSDYMNATIDSVILRVWNQSSQKPIEYSYPTQLNVTSLSLNGSSLLNISFLNGSWPSGWYWGEVTLRNSENETSNGYLWFSVRPFRVQASSSSYSIDSDQCINSTISIYDPDWYSSTPLVGNYSVISVYEYIWSGSGSSQTTYTNYTSTSFNATGNITFCPNNGAWSGGSWGGYHYLNVVVKDNVQNDTEVGWLSFRTIPFQISWGSVNGGTGKATNAAINVPVTLTRSSGGNATGNLTNIYQWRYDASTQYRSVKESYVFSVGSCYSNVSSQCTVNGTQNVTIYAPSSGWKVGYNYLNADWAKQNDASSSIQDWSTIYFEGRESYNGYFSNTDSNGNWKYYFNETQNITIKIFVRDSNYNGIAANITGVSYSLRSGSCYSEWCRQYTSATWGLIGGGVQTASDGTAIITIKAPNGLWARGEYDIKATISGSSGTGTITGSQVKVRDETSINITIVSPVNNATYNNGTFLWSMTTTKNAQCYVSIYNYYNFHNWNCGGWNVTNSSNTTSVSPQKIGACNTTLYTNYNGTSYFTFYASDQYTSKYDGSTSTWTSGSTGLSTGSTSHTYTVNITNWTVQYYGLYSYCYDSDGNSNNEVAAFKVQPS